MFDCHIMHYSRDISKVVLTTWVRSFMTQSIELLELILLVDRVQTHDLVCTNRGPNNQIQLKTFEKMA